MPANKKYTKYASPASSQHDLLNRLFSSKDPLTAPPSQDLVGKENEVADKVIEIARQYLTPRHQDGDLSYFPNGVNLDFSGDPSLNVIPPETSEVKWQRPGDPANPYTPDLSSPGPGKTSGTDKNVDPKIAISDVKPNYVPAAPGTSTRSPNKDSAQIVEANVLGQAGELGAARPAGSQPK